MRVVLSFVIGCLAFGFAAASRASAQYPIYAPQSYGPVVHQHGHHTHHYVPSTTQYYAGYGASGYQYAPNVGYPPVYGGAVLSQPVAPPSSLYYPNSTYYGAPSAHLHHGWHPGHYLLGHH